jgi:hypothetical protein
MGVKNEMNENQQSLRVKYCAEKEKIEFHQNGVWESVPEI